MLSGDELLKIFHSFGFFAVKQKGSHVKLQRLLANTSQTLTVPLHDEIDRGTLREIFNQAMRYIPEDHLRKHFYTE